MINKDAIKAEWEDEMYRFKNFINELSNVQNLYFENLFQSLKKDGFVEIFETEESARDWLFDYLFNENEEIDFWDYLNEHGQ